MRFLFCVYTCKNHSHYLQDFKRSELFEKIKRDGRFETVEVYAHPSLSRPIFESGMLVLNCEEDYSKLSLKTYHMIESCLGLEFDFLLKADCTLVNYQSRSLEKHDARAGRLSLDFVLDMVFDDSFFDQEYNGLIYQRTNEGGFNKWAKAYNVETDYRKVFEGGRDSSYYYTGKFYSLGRRFCQFIAKYGYDVALEHVRYLAGSEDLMIGRLYDLYSKTKDGQSRPSGDHAKQAV